MMGPVDTATARLGMAILGGALALTSCELTGPRVSDTLTLVSVNGQPLPVTNFAGTNGNGQPRIIQYTSGSLTLISGGRAVFSTTRIVYDNGIPEDQPIVPRVVFTVADGENPINRGLRTIFSANGDSVRVSSWYAFDKEVFLFVRQRE